MNAVPLLLIETDVFSDVDDLGALAVACALAASGHAKILSIGVNTPSRFGPLAVRALLDELACDAPIGDLGRRDDSVYAHDFARFVAETFPHADRPEGADPEPAWRVHRRALAGAASGSVTAISLGFFDNFVALLDSPPDELSPLPGRELVRDRVHRTVTMGGVFPTGTEFNLAHSPTLSARFLRDWPSPVEFLGYEVGASVVTGRRVSQESSSVVGAAYRHFTGAGRGRESWDPLTVLLAVPSPQPLFRLSAAGRVSVSATGANSFDVDPLGTHRYAIAIADDETLAFAVDSHLE
ncbi:nucleoside hydrolase [Microbacterium saperdae]